MNAQDFSPGGRVESGLLWGIDFTPEGPRDVETLSAGHRGCFRWLHLNLADNAVRGWIDHCERLPRSVRDILLARDTHQRALVDGGATCCVIHDFERDFDELHTGRIGALRVAIAEDLIVTARLHPLGCADIVRQQAQHGARIDGPASALDLLVGSIIANIDGPMRIIASEVQDAEDSVLAGQSPPSNRALLEFRRRLAQLHRMLDGMQRVFLRLEEDEDLPAALLPTVEKLSQRLQSLDSDALGIQGQLRLLRDEVELEFNQRINRNLYMLTILTTLMLPTTLITGIFGMNTGDLPFTGHGGTLAATLLAAGSALAVFLLLRGKGFFR